MNLSLECLSGALKGQVFPIKPGTTLGRSGNITLSSPNISALHARIEKRPDGSLEIVDNNSKNGIKINGLRIPAATLRPGLRVAIGDYEFSVIEAIQEPEQKRGRSWSEVLVEFIDENRDQVFESRKALAALRPAVRLKFVSGGQRGADWLIGYGPRRIGGKSLDLPIHEAGAPDVCFELIPAPQGAIFKTSRPEVVLLNGKSVDNATLCVGDTIRIHQTVIEVDLIE